VEDPSRSVKIVHLPQSAVVVERLLASTADDGLRTSGRWNEYMATTQLPMSSVKKICKG
jgi:hypothetical protein